MAKKRSLGFAMFYHHYMQIISTRICFKPCTNYDTFLVLLTKKWGETSGETTIGNAVVKL